MYKILCYKKRKATRDYDKAYILYDPSDLGLRKIRYTKDPSHAYIFHELNQAKVIRDDVLWLCSKVDIVRVGV